MDDYYEDDYDEYEEEASEHEEDEQVDKEPSKDEQDFLQLREQLKEKFRKQMKKQNSSSGVHSQVHKRSLSNDKFGSFFGSSQASIAPRVLAESRSIRDTQLSAKLPSASSGNNKNVRPTSKDPRANIQTQKPKVINQVKKKAQTLKDSRDYSFLLSDDADLPAQEQPATRPRPVLSSMGRPAQAPPKNNMPTAKPARVHPVADSQELKNSSTIRRPTNVKPVSRKEAPLNRPKEALLNRPKEAPLNRPKQAPTDSRKLNGNSAGHGLGRNVEHKPLPSKHPVQIDGAKKLPTKSMNSHSGDKKVLLAKHDLSIKNNHLERRQETHGLDKMRAPQKAPSSSAKYKVEQKPSQQNSSSHKPREAQPKKRPARPRSEDEEAIGMIRQLFRYDPRRYAGSDEDDSDMEADFREIEREEKRSSRIAREEDERELRLIEAEEEREREHRMRKKQKLRGS